jgi:hypothetical protein
MSRTACLDAWGGSRDHDSAEQRLWCELQDASTLGLQQVGEEVVVGTLDLYAIRAMPGEVLIGVPHCWLSTPGCG